MGRSARMLTAVLVALVATLLAAAGPASAIKVKVRVEVNQADLFHGLVDRMLVELPEGGPRVPVVNGDCASDSPIAALEMALAALPTPMSFLATAKPGDPTRAT